MVANDGAAEMEGMALVLRRNIAEMRERREAAARSAGPSVSSTVSMAMEMLSASSMSWATSGEVSSGSGSHSPT